MLCAKQYLNSALHLFFNLHRGVPGNLVNIEISTWNYRVPKWLNVRQRFMNWCRPLLNAGGSVLGRFESLQRLALALFVPDIHLTSYSIVWRDAFHFSCTKFLQLCFQNLRTPHLPTYSRATRKLFESLWTTSVCFHCSPRSWLHIRHVYIHKYPHFTFQINFYLYIEVKVCFQFWKSAFYF